MVALLNIVDLRRHALPTDVMATLVSEAGRRAGVLRSSYGDGACPRLLARWHIGSHGRPVCAWSVDGPEDDMSPG